jgi:hypothetical protein
MFRSVGPVGLALMESDECRRRHRHWKQGVSHAGIADRG